MLQVARECSGRDPSDLQMSFGEFCIFSRELKQCYKNHTDYPQLSKKSIEKSHASSRDRDMSFEVFLGGSCNPTTWRQDTAIPMLSRHGITYYNPQVAHWEEALVEAEDKAKKTAAVLFYVLDSSTRNVASMIESAYLAGCHRKLVLVIQNYSGAGQLINGEAISESEFEELDGGVRLIQDIVGRHGIPVFSQVNHALNVTAKILRENIWPQDLGITDKVQPVKNQHIQLGDKLVKLHDAFVNVNSNKINLSQANAVFKVVTNRELTNEELLTIVANKKGVSVQDLNTDDLPFNDLHLTFQEFCCIVAEFGNQPVESRRLWDLLTQSLISPIQKIVDWALPRGNRLPNGQGVRDVYLGGSQGPRILWRENIAIPLLRKHGLSYYVPSMSTTTGGGRFFPMEAASLDNSRVLLFVITNSTRGVAQMTLASYYCSLGLDIVLCVQMMTEGTVINGEEISEAAMKDYNRGRSYLIDQAKRDGNPVFSSIEEAVEEVIGRVNQKYRT
ncbi:hypothetical protein Avbf_00557 [Armadillidium vulgare]|nr:hypothetical protein Avbf_00557 [Armadillidium vulgare]